MHLQSIYEDFCCEDSFLGNKVKTRTDEHSLLHALASCKNQTARISIISPEQSKFLKGTNGAGVAGRAFQDGVDPTDSAKAWHLCIQLSWPPASRAQSGRGEMIAAGGSQDEAVC